jgi:hypothetical protein
MGFSVFKADRPALLPSLGAGEWVVLAIAIILAAAISVGAHDLAISHLGVPYPYDSAVPAWAKFLGQFVRFAMMVVLCRIAGAYLNTIRVLPAMTLVGVLLIALNETLRVIAINWVIVDGWHGLNGVNVLLTALPEAVFYFYQGAIAVVIARYRPRLYWRMPAVVLAATSIGYFGLPLLDQGVVSTLAALHVPDPAALYNPPYGWNVYRYIYGMFAEPAIAALLMARLLWPGLVGPTPSRVGMFVVLMLLVRGRIVSEFLFSFWIAPPRLVAFAAEGQFFVETLLLSLLCGLICEWIDRRTDPHWG